MINIGIIKSTGNVQGNLILAGVYGEHQANAIEGGLASFRVAPEFRRVSHLFGYLEEGRSPVQPTDVHILQVPPEQEHLAKAQLMSSLGRKWAKLYEGVTPPTPGLMASMLKGESAQVAAGAKNHLIAMGMRAWMVPVEFEVTSSENASGLEQNERGLIQALNRGEAANYQLVDQGAPMDLGTGAVAESAIAQARDALAEPLPAGGHEGEAGAVGQQDAPAEATAPTWADFIGMNAHVAGSILVVAPDAEAAKQAAVIQLDLAQACPGIFRPEVAIESILSVTNRELDRDFDDFDGEEDGDDDLRERPY